MELKSQPVSMAREWHQYAEEKHFWFQWRFKALLKYQGMFPSVTFSVFEIGCGTGTFLRQFTGKYTCRATGCELDNIEIPDNESAYTLIKYNIFDSRPDLENSFEVVFLMDVIEHIDDDVEFLKRASKFIKPGGMIVINVPALTCLFSKYDRVAGHYRRYNRRQLKELVNKSGLQVIKTAYWGETLLPVAIIRKFFLRFVPVEKVIKKGFVPPGPLADRILRFMMWVDLRYNRHLLGTSLLAFVKKRK